MKPIATALIAVMTPLLAHIKRTANSPPKNIMKTVGIQDEDSYFWRSYLPLPGRQRGWRQRVLQVAAVFIVLAMIGGFVATIAGH